MADESDIERDLQRLVVEMKKLETEHTMFFSGHLKRPPWETRTRAEKIIRRWDRAYIDKASGRFRFGTLQSRFSTFADLWDRG